MYFPPMQDKKKIHIKLKHNKKKFVSTVNQIFCCAEMKNFSNGIYKTHRKTHQAHSHENLRISLNMRQYYMKYFIQRSNKSY